MRLRRLWPGRLGLFLVMWVFAFGVYATTASPYLHGYDPQAADTAQGFFETGRFEFPAQPLYATPPDIAPSGKRVSRIGLPQALFMVPFYGAGAMLDDAFPRANAREPFAALALGFYEPFVAATAAALFTLIMLQLKRSEAWAVVAGFLFTVASIAWPYSKIGMETTVMLGMVITFAGVVHARGDSVWPWVAAGFGGGMAVAGKAYEFFAVAALLTILVPLLRRSEPRRRMTLAAAVLLPAAVWMVAIGIYNWSRFDSPFNFGQANFEPTLAAPLNAMGFYVSPGKGLLWYSPLVVVGLLGFKALAARSPRIAIAVAGALFAGTAVVAVNPYWTDETWGPRYLVPVAWLLLVPLPFWAVTRARHAVVAGIATIAVAVQLVGVIAPYEAAVAMAPQVVGYDPVTKPRGGPPSLGDDAQRWVPQVSPLLVQGALVTSAFSTSLHLPPVTFSYRPYRGAAHRVVMSARAADQLGVPDLWWLPKHNGWLGTAVVLPALAALLAAVALSRRGLAGAPLPAWMRREVARRASRSHGPDGIPG